MSTVKKCQKRSVGLKHGTISAGKLLIISNLVPKLSQANLQNLKVAKQRNQDLEDFCLRPKGLALGGDVCMRYCRGPPSFLSNVYGNFKDVEGPFHVPCMGGVGGDHWMAWLRGGTLFGPQLQLINVTMSNSWELWSMLPQQWACHWLGFQLPTDLHFLNLIAPLTKLCVGESRFGELHGLCSYLSIYLSFFLSIYLSIYLSIHPSIHPSILPSFLPSFDLCS